MRRTIILFSILFSIHGSFAQPKSWNRGINVVPLPLSIEAKSGNFELNEKTVIVAPTGSDQTKVALFFSEKIKASTGFPVHVIRWKTKGNFISLELDSTLDLNNEGYILNVSEKNIFVKAKTSRGFFYGMQTLLQLLPAEIESAKKNSGIKWSIPCVAIKDEPRFPWRGLHLDVCRHFMSVDFIKKQLDVLAMMKLNKFHWHLTEDQGWRIEIKKYPRLTSIGAKRIEGDGSVYEGFYTQEQIREVVAYAAARFIDVIPEIEMPGHALAALAAYPELSCTGGPFTPRILWGIETDVFCAGNEETYKFLEDVISEIIPLFPYEYFHVGGDECPKDRWNKCPKCKVKMNKEHLKDADELQSYFIARMEKVLIAHGKKMIGWDEILEGGLSPSANVMSWRGEKGGIEAANMGHDVVMSPGKFMYLNYYQGNPKMEPLSKNGFITPETLYNYEPLPKEIAPEKSHHILGAQGNVWTEYIYKEEQGEYMIYPRILSLAELTWTAKEKRNYKDFERRLNNQLVRLDGHNINYHIPLPEGPTSQIAFVDTVSLAFTTTRPVKMVYTLDGSEPAVNSMTYQKPLKFSESKILKIASVLPHGKMSMVRKISVEKQSYINPLNVSGAKPGLRIRTAKGYFLKVVDTDTVKNWTESTIDSIAQVNTMIKWGFVINEKNFRAVEMTGYIEIPEDGVYFFSSNQDQVWIADKLIINNDGLVKRDSRNDGSIALRKGKHKLKIIYLYNIIGGWPADWTKLQLQYRNSKDLEFKKVGEGMIWY